MRDTPSWAGRHLPGPGWSSGWSHRWLSWSCGGHFPSPLGSTVYFYCLDFQPLYVKVPGVAVSWGGGKILLVAASKNGSEPFC